MNARNVATLTVRLAGAVGLCRALVNGGSTAAVFTGAISAHNNMSLSSQLGGILSWLALLAASLAIPVVIIWQADRLARWLVPGDDNGIELAVKEHFALSVALCILGLYLIGIAIPSLAKAFVQYLMLDRPVAAPDVSSARLVVSLAGHAVQFLFGLVLFLQAGGIARFWQSRQKPVSPAGSE